MNNKKIGKSLFVFAILFLGIAMSQETQNKNIIQEGIVETFPPKDGIIKPLKGNIIEGRYFSPKQFFSCKAFDFGHGYYTAQDLLNNDVAIVAFYDCSGSFKKIEIFNFPQIKDKTFNLKMAFETFGISILKEVDHAEGIEILKEESNIEEGLFVVISIKKMSVLKSENGKNIEAVRGYLIYQENEKLIMISNQIISSSQEKHILQNNIEELKNGVLEFRKSLKFDYKKSAI